MMSFPLDYHGEINWKGNAEGTPEQIQERFLKSIDVELHRSNGNNIRYIDNMITFSGGIRWLGFNYNATAYVTTGFVEIKQADDGFLISYYLNFKQMFIMSCAAMLFYLTLILLGIMLTDASNRPPIYIVLILISIMPVSYTCIGYPNAILRFRALLKHALKNM